LSCVTLCSLAADLRVTQVVNGSKGIHVVLKKELLRWVATAPALRSASLRCAGMLTFWGFVQ